MRLILRGLIFQGLDRFLDVADKHPGIFYRFESDNPSGYVSQDLAQTFALLEEGATEADLLPDSFIEPGMGKYGTLIRQPGDERWELYHEQYAQIRRGETEGTWELFEEKYDRESGDFKFLSSGSVDVGYVGRRGLYGHVDSGSFVDVHPEARGFRAYEKPLQLSDTDRHFSIHFGTPTPFRKYIGDLSSGEDVFLSHGVLARLPAYFDAYGRAAQQRYSVDPNLGEFIEAGNVNLNWLSESIESLPENMDADRIWGDYLAGREGSDRLGLERAFQLSRQWLEERHRGARSGRGRTDLHSLDLDELNAELNELVEDEQLLYDDNFMDSPTPVEANPDILFGPDPLADVLVESESISDILFESEIESFTSDISSAHESVMSVQPGRGLGLGQRLSRWFGEAKDERAWGWSNALCCEYPTGCCDD